LQDAAAKERKTMRFRIIPGYTAYEISSDGNVIRRVTASRRYKTGHTTKQRLHPNGYKHVNLVNDAGERKGLRVHRLVAAAFIGDPGGLEINHKDGVKTNNRVKNLELVTGKENVAHSIKVLGNSNAGERHYGAKLKESDIPAILDRRRRGETQQEIANDYGVARQTISYICTGKTWKHAVASPALGS
jgi:hypothetical protein